MAETKTEDPPHSPDIHFEPIVRLEPVVTKTLEDDEEEIFKMRSKLYRYDSKGEPAEWKERGVGDVKILRHKNSEGRSRILMRRDKTLKICANHFITPFMKLQPNCGSEKAWVWTTPADFADEEPKAETLAIRFANAENAQKFKEKFEECQCGMSDTEKQDIEKPEKSTESTSEKSANEIADKLGEMTVKEEEGATPKEAEGVTAMPSDAGGDGVVTKETKDDADDDKTNEKTQDTKEDNKDGQPKKEDESKKGEASED